MKKLLALLLLFGIVSCSSKIESFTVLCETDMFFDKSLTFDFETNTVNVKNTLNKYGYESKKVLESAGPSAVGDERTIDMMSIFEESEQTMYIRSFDDGLIIYGNVLEPREDFDMQSTFNRASLKIKTVTKYGDVFNIEEDNNLERENVSYAECMKPTV